MKSSTRYDPTDQMITKGTKTFYALTGAGAYTGGLFPHHCARLWKAYCAPRMLYGVVVYKLTQVMRNKLDRAQHQLFKKILGLPNSAADEAVYLLTGLIPLSMQADQETLLVIGQLVNLPHSRYEVRTLLHAFTQNTPMLRKWEDTLRHCYKLPDLSSLICKPILNTIPGNLPLNRPSTQHCKRKFRKPCQLNLPFLCSIRRSVLPVIFTHRQTRLDSSGKLSSCVHSWSHIHISHSPVSAS